MKQPEYLPILDQSGAFIDGAESLLLFASRYPKLSEILEVFEAEGRDTTIYPLLDGRLESAHKGPDNAVLRTTFKGTKTKRREVDRRLTAATVFEMYAYSKVCEGQPISLGKARERAARKDLEFRIECDRALSGEGGKGTVGHNIEAHLETVKRAFRNLRPVAHFALVGTIWDDEYRYRRPKRPVEEWVGMARSMEQFLDRHLSPTKHKWNPIRVPREIEPVPVDLEADILKDFRESLSLPYFKGH